MNNIDVKEPVYHNEDMIKLANVFCINLDNLVIKRYTEIAEIKNAIKLFDIYNEKRKELEKFFINAEKPETILPEFIFLCLKFNPQFYNFAQMLLTENKKKKLKKSKNVKSIITNCFHKKTK